MIFFNPDQTGRGGANIRLQDFSNTTSRITSRQLNSTQLGTTRLKSCFIVLIDSTKKTLGFRSSYWVNLDKFEFFRFLEALTGGSPKKFQKKFHRKLSNPEKKSNNKKTCFLLKKDTNRNMKRIRALSAPPPWG